MGDTGVVIGKLKCLVRSQSAKLRREVTFYRFLLMDPRTPKLARWLLGGAVAYTVTPLDLIPDFVPILGQLDDLLIVPGLIFLALKLIPGEVLSDSRERAKAAGGANSG